MNMKFPVAVTIAILLCLSQLSCTREDLLRGAEQVREQLGGDSASLTVDEIAAGLKEALKVGSARVSEDLGQVNAFYNDPDIRIPLPEKLRDVQRTLERVGLGSLGDELQLKLNRAAERAAPEARDVFWTAIGQMSLRDVMDIYNGPDDAATRYFQRVMSAELAERFRPIIEEAMLEVGAVRSYDEVMNRYQAIPFVPDIKADLAEHVVDESLGGIFHYLAREEAAIRNDPVARTTELLRRVFGS